MPPATRTQEGRPAVSSLARTRPVLSAQFKLSTRHTTSQGGWADAVIANFEIGLSGLANRAWGANPHGYVQFRIHIAPAATAGASFL